jgi:hypothetical protein
MTPDGTTNPEADADDQGGLAASRETGGVVEPDQPDQASTTGSTPTPEYVGRVAGDDLGYAEETGAERRAEAADQKD